MSETLGSLRPLLTTAIQPALDLSVLPNCSDPVITIETATPAEFEHACRLEAIAFKGFLSDSSFIDRQFHLGNAEIAKDGGMQTWILTLPTLPLAVDGSRYILAACKTMRKTAYIAQDGNIESVVAHGIGSVFCRLEYRGRGYASRMFKDLAQKLETFQQVDSGKGRFSVLYSDIGREFYAKTGWKPYPSTHISLKPIDNAGEYHQRKAEIVPLPRIEDLHPHDLEDLPLVENLKARLTKLSLAKPTETLVTFRPDAAQLEWHFMREEFLAERLGREKPQTKGAIDRLSGVALIWSRTHGENPSTWTLNILYVHIPLDIEGTENLQRSLSALLLRAQYEAKVWEMRNGIEVWDPQEDTLRAARAISRGQKLQVMHRDQKHICSLKWNGSDADKVVWVANERFAWL